jgi:hypothetical protein
MKLSAQVLQLSELGWYSLQFLMVNSRFLQVLDPESKNESGLH